MPDGSGLQPPPGDTFYLSEVSPQDKPWDIHRAEADQVRNLYAGSVYDCYASRISGCSGVLQFDIVPSDDGLPSLKLTGSHFCRVRHCPVCQWRRQLRWRARFFEAMPRILQEYPKAKFLFLTLTVRNCSISELRSQLLLMNKSWERLTKRKPFPAVGWLKSVEVTRSTFGDAHPHFHTILMVNPGYFTHGYIPKARWIELWRESLRADYDPWLDIKVVKPKVKDETLLHEDLMKSLCEVLKYSVKPEDIAHSQDWLLQLTEQLHKTRSISVGGVFKKFISDKEPEDLIGNDDDNETLSNSKIWFAWREQITRYMKIPDPS